MFAGLSVRTLIVRTVALAGIVVMTFPSTSTSAAQDSDCTVEERRNVLRAMQAQVLEVAPRQLDSLEKAIEPRAVLVEDLVTRARRVCTLRSGARRQCSRDTPLARSSLSTRLRLTVHLLNGSITTARMAPIG